MVQCDNCNGEFEHLPFNCNYCGGSFCSNCHLPEKHDCLCLPKENIFHRIKKSSKKEESPPASHVSISSDKFGDYLLQKKQEKVLEYVRDACIARGKPISKVNFDGCNQESGNELAHIHLAENKICISRRNLYKLNYDDIFDTITHEVAHLFEQNHSDKFHKEHQKTRQLIWKPPPGVTIYRAGQSEEKPRLQKVTPPPEPQVDEARLPPKVSDKYRKEEAGVKTKRMSKYELNQITKRKRGENEPPVPDRLNSVEWVGDIPTPKVNELASKKKEIQEQKSKTSFFKQVISSIKNLLKL